MKTTFNPIFKYLGNPLSMALIATTLESEAIPFLSWYKQVLFLHTDTHMLYTNHYLVAASCTNKMQQQRADTIP